MVTSGVPRSWMGSLPPPPNPVVVEVVWVTGAWALLAPC